MAQENLWSVHSLLLIAVVLRTNRLIRFIYRAISTN